MKQILIYVLLAFLLLTMGCNSHFQKVKTFDLHKKSLLQENTRASQEALLTWQQQNGVFLQSDSSTYWLWFESANPFQFHPKYGLVAENGELLLGGQHGKIVVEQGSTLLLESEWKDSSTSVKLVLEEEELLKSSDTVRKRKYWLWGLMVLMAGVVVWSVGSRKVFTFFH